MSIYNKARFYQEWNLDPNRNYTAEEIRQIIAANVPQPGHLVIELVEQLEAAEAASVERKTVELEKKKELPTKEPKEMESEIIDIDAPSGDEDKEVIGEYKEAPAADILKDSEPAKGESLTPKKTAKKKKA